MKRYKTTTPTTTNSSALKNRQKHWKRKSFYKLYLKMLKTNFKNSLIKLKNKTKLKNKEKP